jgi:hypothetical protein
VEEVVSLDLCRTLGSQALLCIAVEQSSQEVARGRWDNLWTREVQGLGENLAVHVVGVLVVERWETRQHLVQKDTESPPIDRLRVPGAGEELGCEIFWCSTERWQTLVDISMMFSTLLTVCSVFVLHVKLAKTKVAQRDVSSVIKKDVLGLQVTVDDVETV